MPRSSWKGFIRLSLVSVPVKAFTASSSGGGHITLHQLHDECHSRIRYEKTCPLHGAVSNDEIVRGYEYAKGQYAVIDVEEIDKLRTESDKAITIDKFVDPSLLDPVYYSGRTYYLAPDGPAGQKPYILLQRAMAEENVCCIAQVVLSGKEQLVTLRAVDNLIAMTTLNYESEIKQPEAFRDEVVGGDVSGEELRLTKMLIDATKAEELDLSQYHDLYTERLTTLIQTKVEGKEIVTAPAEEAPSVINLMDALKASVKQAQETTPKAPAKAAAARKSTGKRKVAASAKKRKTAGKDKKTG